MNGDKMKLDKNKPVKKADKELVKNTIEINPTLKEASGKTAVIAWGRMNPITVGHEKLVDKVLEVARKSKADPMVFLSHTQDPKKNPLSYDDKLRLAKTAFGSIIKSSASKTIIDIMKQLQGQYDNVILVAGQDRINEFQALLTKYNGKDYTFDSITVVSAGERDPDADDVTGMSASKMRALALQGDQAAFTKGLPKKLQAHAADVYKLVRAGMRIAEGLELEEAVLTIAQRLKRAQVLRRNEPKLKAARLRAAKRMAAQPKLINRARKKAIELIRARVAGERGANYHDLSASEKIQIDKQVEKRKKAIGKIAARLLPSVRKAEMIRFQHATHGNVETVKVNESFEAFMEASMADTKPKKRFHDLFKKDKTVKFDKRFKFNRHVNEEVESDLELLELIDEAFVSFKLQEQKSMSALLKKAELANVDFDVVLSVYHEGLNEEHGSHLTDEQYAFNKVNSFVAEASTRMPHLLNPGLSLKQQLVHGLTHRDLDIDGDVDSLDKTTPSDITGIEKNVYNKMMKKYAGEKKHTAAGKPAYESAGLWANINARRKQGLPPKKPGEKGYPTTLKIEGVNDPSIFKAVFLAGGPGSGKSFIVGKTALTALGFKVINSDDIFERALAKVNLKPTPEDIYSPLGQQTRDQAKVVTGKKLELAISGRLGLVIDGTGKDYAKIEKQADKLRAIGYEVAMIFVNTDLDTALARNRMRARSLPDDEVSAMWKDVQKNLGKFQNFFRQKMFIIDNSEGSNYEGAVLSTYRKIAGWAKTKPETNAANDWIKAKTVKEESVNEAFESMLTEETQCALITQADIRELEKFADDLLAKYGIDIEFTKHFGDRMSDERNTPCINVKELKDFFRKVYANAGAKIKGNVGLEVVIKDLQKSLNMPVVIDRKKGEVEVTFKTIMRKKNFTSSSKTVQY
jgi:nicotinic acid mononucleotide adenylyltransferase/predicted kinase